MELRILHLEDSAEDAFLIHHALKEAGLSTEIQLCHTRKQFEQLLASMEPDLILADGSMAGFSGMQALTLARAARPEASFVFLSGSQERRQADAALAAGADDFVQKDDPARLISAVRCAADKARLRRANRGMVRLVAAVQELSLARDLDSIMKAVRSAAREMTGADGATFVLRDDDKCFYAEENAISPLWKGQRFPLNQCISGWVMLNRQPAVIEDIYSDPRIPADAYRPTFVKSLAMVPIRTESPIGAIGIYWAKRRQPHSEEVELLHALANTASVAMENVNVYSELERRVEKRTTELAIANEELESFAYAVSHDLSAPLRCIRGYAELLLRECQPTLDDTGKLYLGKVLGGTQQMRELIDDLLRLSRVTQAEMLIRTVNLTKLAEEKVGELRAAQPERGVEVKIGQGIEAKGDRGLLRVALDNLLSNAWKFTSRVSQPVIEFGCNMRPDGSCEFFVRDNGAGFDMQFADKLFRPFRRLHTQEDFPGSGIGLCTVKRVMQRHGGSIRAEGAPDKGAAFYFTLGC